MRTKQCEECDKQVTVAFRVMTKQQNSWGFVCMQCCEKLRHANGYRYGGTWKG